MREGYIPVFSESSKTETIVLPLSQSKNKVSKAIESSREFVKYEKA